MKGFSLAMVAAFASGATLAQSPSEEFDARIPSGRPPTLQLDGGGTLPSGPKATAAQVRVMNLGRRAPRSGPSQHEDQSAREYQQGRDQADDAWKKRTYSQPVKAPQVVCEGSPTSCSLR